MTTTIFYFTGSGNALAIARTLASRIEGAEVAPIAQSLNPGAAGESTRIGIVTPVYAWGLPRMVGDFASQLTLPPAAYVFAVATSAGTTGRTLVQLQNRLRKRGGDLHAGFSVLGDFQPYLPGMDDMAIIRLASWLGRKDIPRSFSERVEEIVSAITSPAHHAPETTNRSVDALSRAVYPLAMRMMRTVDRSFSVSEACTSCGICARVCPRENVTLTDGEPRWNGDCESCYACLLSCPSKAIGVRGTPPSDAVRHPEIALSDLFLR